MVWKDACRGIVESDGRVSLNASVKPGSVECSTSKPVALPRFQRIVLLFGSTVGMCGSAELLWIGPTVKAVAT